MGFATALLTAFTIYAAVASSTVHSFNCSSSGSTCNGLVGYVSPNSTTLSIIQTLFGIDNFPSLLGANNLPLSTPTDHAVAANQTIKIPFQCLCSNGTGMANNRRPLYKVVAEDGLYHIAAEVFGRLVTYQQIQAANNIPDANQIVVGQEVWIPLPCSCDEVGGERVVHYGHVVQPGSTVEEIAQQYNTSAEALLTLNALSSAKDLMAYTVLDVPLKACTSMVADNKSMDYPLLVANGTYAVTAADCVMCNCDATNNWTLQCKPSQVIKSSLWATCPSMQCQGAENLYLGNTTTTLSTCNRTTCAYAGYTNQTILTALASESICPVSDNHAPPKFSVQGGSWSYLLISIHLLLLCLHFIN